MFGHTNWAESSEELTLPEGRRQVAGGTGAKGQNNLLRESCWLVALKGPGAGQGTMSEVLER